MSAIKYSRKENIRLYRIYHGIKARCYNQNERGYKYYGARGIKMCAEWLDPQNGFDVFADWAFANGYSDSLSIERVNVNGDYEPDNCKWIAKVEQAKNKRSTIWVDYNGQHIQLCELCKQKGLKYDTIHNRLFRFGWDLEKAIEQPIPTEKTLAERSREMGLLPGTVQARVKKFGWSVEEALNTPTIGRGANYKTYSHTS